MHAPQSQFRSDVHVFLWQWCGEVDFESQAVFCGHVKPPPTHETSEQPFGVWFCPEPQVVPAGQVYPSVAQLANAHPCASAPARVGAQMNPAAHA